LPCTIPYRDAQEYATYQTGLPLPNRRSNVNAAIAGAAYEIFNSYFGGSIVELSKYNSILFFQLDFLRRNGVSDNRITQGLAYGKSIADALLASRANDGFNVIPSFVPQTADGFWQPTPPDFTPALGNGWPAVTPWGLSNNLTFYFPPAGNTYIIDPARYIADFTEEIGRGRDTNDRFVSTVQRTATETFVGIFWANDFGGTSLPPGQYLTIAQTVAGKQRLSRSKYTRFLALVSLVIANINIVAWDVKYTFQEWRPVTAVQNAGNDAYPETVGDPTWTPLSITSPAFPDYVSGHATFGYGLANILRLLLGTDTYTVSIESDNLPQVVATYKTFTDIAIDNSESRIFLGVHFRAAIEDAAVPGNLISTDIYNNQLKALP